MTKLLDEAIEKVRALPEPEQNLAAEAMLAFAERDKPYRLTPEQLEEVRAALEEVERGEIVSDEEMAAFWKNYGL